MVWIESSELRSCVKMKVAVLGSSTLISLMVSVDVKQQWRERDRDREFHRPDSARKTRRLTAMFFHKLRYSSWTKNPWNPKKTLTVNIGASSIMRTATSCNQMRQITLKAGLTPKSSHIPAVNNTVQHGAQIESFVRTYYGRQDLAHSAESNSVLDTHVFCRALLWHGVH